MYSKRTATGVQKKPFLSERAQIEHDQHYESFQFTSILSYTDRLFETSPKPSYAKLSHYRKHVAQREKTLSIFFAVDVVTFQTG